MRGTYKDREDIRNARDLRERGRMDENLIEGDFDWEPRVHYVSGLLYDDLFDYLS